MMRPFARLGTVGGAVLLGAAGLHAVATAAQTPPPAAAPQADVARQLSPEDARALADFNARITRYSEMHKRLEATLSKVPSETTPEIIDQHQRALEKLIRSERRNAQPGDILTAGARRVLRQMLARVITGAEGREIKATILDDNPGSINVRVNSRYPDEIPLSTVPPQVLSALPKLPDELEYRFIGERLILLDPHAHMIADVMDKPFPR